MSQLAATPSLVQGGEKKKTDGKGEGGPEGAGGAHTCWLGRAGQQSPPPHWELEALGGPKNSP